MSKVIVCSYISLLQAITTFNFCFHKSSVESFKDKCIVCVTANV